MVTIIAFILVKGIDPPIFGDIQRISIVYTWTGLAPWPSRYDAYEVTCQGEVCSAAGQRSAKGALGSQSYLNGTTPVALHHISFTVVQAMRSALVNLKPAFVSTTNSNDSFCKDSSGLMFHSEVYSEFMVTLVTTTGQIVIIEHDAHCPSPWYVAVGIQQFIQTTGEIPAAYRTLVGAIDPDFNYGQLPGQ